MKDIKSLQAQISKLQSDQPQVLGDWSESLKQLYELKCALDETSIIAVTDASGVISYVNDTFCKISKYDRDELVGKTHRIIRSNYHPKGFFKDVWQQISSGKVWRQEICNKAKDGSLYWVDTTIIPFLNEDNKPYQYLAIRNEVTDKVVMQMALEELSNFSIKLESSSAFKDICHSLQKLLDVSCVVINEFKFQQHRSIAVHSKEQIDKQDLSDLMKFPWEQLIHKNEKKCISNNFESQFSNWRILKTVKVESFIGMPLKKSTGEVIGSICLIDDKKNAKEGFQLKIIDLFARKIETEMERQQALNTLKENESRIKAVINSSLDGIIIVRDKGKIESCNPAASQILQCCSLAVIGTSIESLLPDLFKSQNIETQLKEFVNKRHLHQGQEVLKHLPSGRALPLHITITEVKLEKYSLYTLTIRSLKEQRETEEKLQNAESQLTVQTLFTQRLSALAAMAGGVAHELNQPLSGIRVYAQMLNKFLETPATLKPDLAQEVISKVIAQVDRAAKVIDHMRDFSAEKGDQKLQLSKVSLFDVIESSLELIGQQLYSKGICFINEVNTEEKVLANESRLEQILINLFSNAKDSLVEKSNKKDLYIKVSSKSLDDAIELLVEDNGGGIHKDVQRNLFEPFVTSKEPGSGTGLGLSICIGILKDFGASISLLNTDKNGTVFKLKFPKVK